MEGHTKSLGNYDQLRLLAEIFRQSGNTADAETAEWEIAKADWTSASTLCGATLFTLLVYNTVSNFSGRVAKSIQENIERPGMATLASLAGYLVEAAFVGGGIAIINHHAANSIKNESARSSLKQFTQWSASEESTLGDSYY